MSGQLLTWGIFIGGMLLFACAFIVWAFWKRGKYRAEVIGKHKVWFLPEGSVPEMKIVTVEQSGVEFTAPEGHHCPRYFFSKETSWNTKYPENPPFGMTFVCVEIGTSWYGKDNPEPLSPYQHRPIATASMIFASIDRAFALAIGEMEAQIEEYKKKYLDAMANKISPMVFYIAIGLNVVLTGIVIYLIMQDTKIVKAIADMFGIVTK